MTQSNVGICGLGAFAPPETVTASQLAAETGIPAAVLEEKFGVRQVHRAGPDCHVSDMAVAAGSQALEDAGLDPLDVDLVVYCGSEYKDFIVWSAASHVAGRLGCSRAEAYEVYALCAGSPITLRIVKDMMTAEPEIRTALIVAASKESSLVDRTNDRARFMFNFGDGGGAVVVKRDFDANLILGSASILDSSLSMSALMPAGGSRNPPTSETISSRDHFLDVTDLEGMRVRLDAVSLDNFLRVSSDALRRSGLPSADFLASVHMKRSMQHRLLEELHIERSLYLEDYGHMQAADQFVILKEARDRGMLQPGDMILLLAAGVGYTWAASIVQWGPAA